MFVAVAGAAPGIGKSTLAGALAGWLSAQGLSVDHFREEEILTRPEFAAVAAEFGAGGEVGLATLRAAMVDYVASFRAAGTDVVVADAAAREDPRWLAWILATTTSARAGSGPAIDLTPTLTVDPTGRRRRTRSAGARPGPARRPRSRPRGRRGAAGRQVRTVRR